MDRMWTCTRCQVTVTFPPGSGGVTAPFAFHFVAVLATVTVMELGAFPT